MNCRHCGSLLSLTFVDLGTTPVSNAYLTANALTRAERKLPLKVLACEHCWLVQTEDYAKRDELFDNDYAYFSGYSKSWLKHCERYVAEVVARFSLSEDSHVVEVAANDGYLLQYFVDRRIPCVGIEPTASTAAAARDKGISIIEEFFGEALAKKLGSRQRANLMIANNVLAHVPEINDFVAGFPHLLHEEGVATFEFPHLLRLVAENQFDTIYHEHFSYLSLTTVSHIFASNGLQIFDVEEHPTHGGSLRVFAQRSDTGRQRVADRVVDVLERETRSGVRTVQYYAGFQAKADRVKNDLLQFLSTARSASKKVAAYGAAAKGNTLLNYASVDSELVSWVADRNPAKLGKYLPGSRIPIVSEDHIRRERPDYILILPWNLKAEITSQLAYIREWGGKFVWAVPELAVQ